MKITLAVPKNKKGMSTFLKKEINAAKNIKSKNTKEQVIKGLQKILVFDQMSNVIFYYDGVDDKLTYEVYDGIDFIYHCGRDFIKPEAKRKGLYLLVAMDTKECTIGVLDGKRIETIWHETSDVMGKHNNGGQSAARFERGRNEAIKQWYKKISHKLQEIMMER